MRTTPGTRAAIASARVVLPEALTPSMPMRLPRGSPAMRATSASDEELGMELRPPLRAAGDETDERVADLDVTPDALAAEDFLERARLRLRVVGLEVQFGKAEAVVLLEQLLDPVPGRMQLEPVAGVRRDERPPDAVLLHAELRLIGACKRDLELLFVERKPEMVDAGKRPLTRLHDDVHRPELELREPQLEADRIELRPRHPRLVGREVLADAAVPGDQVEAKFADVARLDFAHAARHEVIVEEVHGPAW